jgi:small subunit ribosomal protein S21
MSSDSIKIMIDGTRHSVEGSLKKFKRMCEAAGVLKEYRKRKEYKKPSVRMKEKKDAAQKRKAKEQSKYDRTSRM